MKFVKNGLLTLLLLFGLVFARITYKRLIYLDIRKKTALTAEEIKDSASDGVQVLEDFVVIPYLNQSRTIRLYLPPNYESDTLARFPVMYFYDGQWLYNRKNINEHEWEVDERLDEWVKNGGKGAIVVGIDNSEDRANEYNPYIQSHKLDQDNPHGDKFVNFVATELKPFMDSLYRTQAEAAHTTIGGASFGGNLAFYSIMAHPDVFGNAMVLSPSFWVSEEVWKYPPEGLDLNQLKIYFNVGEHEGNSMKKPIKKMYKILSEKGMKPDNLRLDIVEGLDHTQLTWQTGFRESFRWLLE